MSFRHLLGWAVKDSKLFEQTKRHRKKAKDLCDCCMKIERLIIENGCPIKGFCLDRQEDWDKNNTRHSMILVIYEGPKEVDINKVLIKFPPIFETIKRDLGIEGEPRFFLGEP
jgi:hypothetical protein